MLRSVFLFLISFWRFFKDDDDEENNNNNNATIGRLRYNSSRDCVQSRLDQFFVSTKHNTPFATGISCCAVCLLDDAESIGAGSYCCCQQQTPSSVVGTNLYQFTNVIGGHRGRASGVRRNVGGLLSLLLLMMMVVGGGGRGAQSSLDDRHAHQLCSVRPRVRLQHLRHLRWSGSAFGGTAADHNEGDLSLYQLFQLNVLNEAAVDHPNRAIARRLLSHLNDRALDDCLRAKVGSDECVRCYRSLFGRFAYIDHLFGQFVDTIIVSAISCESSSSERFSSVATCSDCQIWYKRWLLVTLSNLWRRPLCKRWCHLVELACPHLSVRRRYDYAGLPSFRCIDLSLPNDDRVDEESLDEIGKCFHPCEMLSETPNTFPSLFCRSLGISSMMHSMQVEDDDALEPANDGSNDDRNNRSNSSRLSQSSSGVERQPWWTNAILLMICSIFTVTVQPLLVNAIWDPTSADVG